MISQLCHSRSSGEWLNSSAARAHVYHIRGNQGSSNQQQKWLKVLVMGLITPTNDLKWDYQLQLFSAKWKSRRLMRIMQQLPEWSVQPPSGSKKQKALFLQLFRFFLIFISVRFHQKSVIIKARPSHFFSLISVKKLLHGHLIAAIHYFSSSLLLPLLL